MGRIGTIWAPSPSRWTDMPPPWAVWGPSRAVPASSGVVLSCLGECSRRGPRRRTPGLLRCRLWPSGGCPDQFSISAGAVVGCLGGRARCARIRARVHPLALDPPRAQGQRRRGCRRSRRRRSGPQAPPRPPSHAQFSRGGEGGRRGRAIHSRASRCQPMTRVRVRVRARVCLYLFAFAGGWHWAAATPPVPLPPGESDNCPSFSGLKSRIARVLQASRLKIRACVPSPSRNFQHR